MDKTPERIDQLQQRADPHQGKQPWHTTPAERVQVLRAVAARLLACDNDPNPPWLNSLDVRTFLEGMWAWFMANGAGLPFWAQRIIALSFRGPGAGSDEAAATGIISDPAPTSSWMKRIETKTETETCSPRKEQR